MIRPRPALRRAAARGFTLLEMMAVVAIIGVLVAVATPRMVQIIKDRRVEETAKNVGRTFTQARVRAMARGTATLFRFTSTPSGSPKLEIRESIAGGVDGSLPGGSCFASDWSNGSPTSQSLMTLDTGSGDFVVEFLDDQDGVHPLVEMCFTPHGRTYLRYGPAAPFQAVTFVPRVRSTNTRTGRERFTFLPASGVGRIQL